MWIVAELAEVDPHGGLVEVPPEGVHFVDQELQTLDLHLGAREAVQDDTVAELGIKEMVKKKVDHLPVADHTPRILDSLGLGRVEQRADDYGAAGEAPSPSR